MKIAKHICFYYQEDRIKYLNQLIDAASKYEDEVDIFIHTHKNKKWLSEKINKYDNLNIQILEHEMHEHPFYLTWKPRILMRKQVQENIYDTYMYVEDDILVSNDTIKYWEKYSTSLNKEKINLGFLRLEKNTHGIYCWTDTAANDLHLLKIESNMLNVGKLSYCAFWIHDKELTKKMLDTIPKTTTVANSRERAALGANLAGYNPVGREGSEEIFTKTCIPLEYNKIPEGCKVYHLPNNYANHPVFLAIEADKVLERAMANSSVVLERRWLNENC
tara:strand:+ start:1068 stop:1895 length:828 start_codon:yes stop_codon:yes gene_type:complete